MSNEPAFAAEFSKHAFVSLLVLHALHTTSQSLQLRHKVIFNRLLKRSSQFKNYSISGRYVNEASVETESQKHGKKRDSVRCC